MTESIHRLCLSDRGNTMEIDGVRLNYHHAGDGRKAIIFLHGNSCAKEVFHEQFDHYLHKSITAIAIDLPGHGKSGNAPHPERQYTIPGYARIVRKFLHALNINNFIIVGWSLGGNIALELIGQMAGMDDALKAALIMGAPPVAPGVEDFVKAYLPEASTSIAAKNNPSHGEITAFVKSVYGSLNPIPEQFFQTALRTDGRARAIMASHWLGGEGGYDQRETVSNWDKPICVVHGLDDPFISLEYLQNITWGWLWRDRIIEMPNCGHAPFIENPKTFNGILDDLISEVF